ncbi:spermine/spermidine synthase [Alkalihalobacillus trypoxylicola]|uniref:Spermine/spermidine synthase n=1 Tax=Alkalihalobacillus trypoxylicola TaxID=519424 RepID=A0A162DEH4_9BACI|nr:spermine/spermidine synthase [Alkalihalobacillus trypoxylicola]KYG29377.1 spermine/spermidine synthase [Alkalihalobacillus trypoxylicola]
MDNLPEVIERCHTERGMIQLQKRNGDYEIIYNGTFLMATYNGESERLLVKAALDYVDNPHSVLIGGLGVGFSLAQALSNPKVKQVDVIEIEEAIIKWNEKHLSQFSSNALKDPRTTIIHDDFIQYMKASNSKYDVICLDIDNGPDWTVAEENNHLYSLKGMGELIGLLKEGGILTFWSATESPHFVKKLRSFFRYVAVKEVAQKKGVPDYVYIVSDAV